MYLTNSKTLADFLEKEIAEGRNPTTPEQWEACMQRMREQGLCIAMNVDAAKLMAPTKDN